MTTFREWSAGRELGLTPGSCGSSHELVPITYHVLLPMMTVMGALGGCFLLVEARLVSPHLAMSSVYLFLGGSCC